MRVSVEDIPTVHLGTKGVLIRIRTQQRSNLGRLWIGKAKVRWARGSTPDRNAKVLTVREFVNYLNGL